MTGSEKKKLSVPNKADFRSKGASLPTGEAKGN